MNEIAHAQTRVVWGLIANTLLAGTKVVGGILGNSYALIADGIESLLDIFGSLIVWGGLRAAERPANDRHPYGYGKAESLAALIVALVLVVAAFGITIQSIREIITPHHAPAPFTLVILVGVIAIKEGLFRFVRRSARSLDSTALRVDAWHHRADAITSAAAFIGISVALIGGPGYESADDYAALIAAAIIGANGAILARQPIRDILDASPDPRMADEVRRQSLAVPGVRAVEKCRIRRAGLSYFVDLHVMVDAEISVREGHDVARAVRRALCQGSLHINDVLVHVEPFEGAHSGIADSAISDSATSEASAPPSTERETSDRR